MTNEVSGRCKNDEERSVIELGWEVRKVWTRTSVGVDEWARNIVRISESGWRETQDDLNSSY